MSDWQRARSRFLVLLALSHGPKHGYEVARFLEQRSSGYFTLSYGTLYPILHKLEQEGLIRGSWREAGQTKRKKVYTLSGCGERALRQESADFEAYTLAFARLMGSAA
jgi:PadR family transcriptional regulator